MNSGVLGEADLKSLYELLIEAVRRDEATEELVLDRDKGGLVRGLPADASDGERGWKSMGGANCCCACARTVANRSRDMVDGYRGASSDVRMLDCFESLKKANVCIWKESRPSSGIHAKGRVDACKPSPREI
jgi:hypothetical protein